MSAVSTEAIWRKKFHQRMFNRCKRHGADWRQVYVDYGGQCLYCGSDENLEFHEPFGEARHGWWMFQRRVLLCMTCHSSEHRDEWGGRIGNRMDSDWIKLSQLTLDVDVEIYLSGGWDKWVQKFGLVDRFGVLIIQYLDMRGDVVPS